MCTQLALRSTSALAGVAYLHIAADQDVRSLTGAAEDEYGRLFTTELRVLE
ncbi:hypothetical protein AB0I53_45710 [Saccharopolyspora sp. NPDC050389]|uniref:hypothetical protein n=1 Tax=Saccharopolyspora sp. NPDC050389 TaxID=3155516 RepID=UPI0034081AC9